MDYAMESFKEDVHDLIEKNVTDFGEIKGSMEDSLDEIDANQRSTDHTSRPFVLRADHHMTPKESFTYQLYDMVSHPVKDWYFYEFESAKREFTDYELNDSEEGFISVSKHELVGLAPSTPGWFYWTVNLVYKDPSGAVLRKFNTTLEM